MSTDQLVKNEIASENMSPKNEEETYTIFEGFYPNLQILI